MLGQRAAVCQRRRGKRARGSREAEERRSRGAEERN
jgi:hypothetical protein